MTRRYRRWSRLRPPATWSRLIASNAEPLGISYFDWVQSDAYDPVAMKAEFHAQWWGNLWTEKIARRE